MKIRMLTGIAGVDFSLAPREETERFSDAEALRMIDAGMAETVESDEQRAEREAAEKAAAAAAAAAKKSKAKA